MSIIRFVHVFDLGELGRLQRRLAFASCLAFLWVLVHKLVLFKRLAVVHGII